MRTFLIRMLFTLKIGHAWDLHQRTRIWLSSKNRFHAAHETIESVHNKRGVYAGWKTNRLWGALARSTTSGSAKSNSCVFCVALYYQKQPQCFTNLNNRSATQHTVQNVSARRNNGSKTRGCVDKHVADNKAECFHGFEFINVKFQKIGKIL